ncbi:SUKH-4 family immunity protein [Streptomyces sp. MBT62]|uniref:SUKH-4 family immunity protein n=1 Tax=Streptomyces sp. MBT62 TaxID=2800410 RepID=UPI00190BEACD|nr:SUKH-4 family immunity protein [Streptomyces sp. MBT62]MBK3571118.1 SUKH-4 family immunity protein [Streptomyces sp. MBT62]
MVTHADLAAWAGPGNVHRAPRQTVAEWDIPAEAKHMLTGVGIPITEQIITHVPYQSEPSPQLVASDGRRFYKLTISQASGLDYWQVFGVQPVTGEVHHIGWTGEARFTNASVERWLLSLHHFGRHLSQSQVLEDPFEDEDAALNELKALADDLKEIDPAAFEGYEAFTWPAFLDRWLW